MAKVTQEILEVAFGRCICTFYNNGKADVMIIDSLEVDLNHRGKGVGTELLRQALELARKHNVDSIELNVNKDNAAAIRLYEKMGFKKTNKDYYRIIL